MRVGIPLWFSASTFSTQIVTTIDLITVALKTIAGVPMSARRAA